MQQAKPAIAFVPKLKSMWESAIRVGLLLFLIALLAPGGLMAVVQSSAVAPAVAEAEAPPALPANPAATQSESPTAKPVAPARAIAGTLIIHGGGNLADNLLDLFLRIAGGDKARLVIIPTASVTEEAFDAKPSIARWTGRGFGVVDVLHTIDRAKADDAAFIEPLTKATAVWIEGGLQSRLAAAYAGTRVEKEIRQVLARGGVVAGTSAGAAIMSRTMIQSGTTDPQMGTGFDLLPGAIIDQHFVARNRAGRLAKALAAHPNHVGYGIDEGTAMIVRGRSIRIMGSSTVSICLPASTEREAMTIEIKDGGHADLIAMSRAAIARSQPPFPPAKLPPAKGVAGTLVIVGGGGTPREALEAFIKAAGGPDAPVAIISTALGDVPPEKPGEVTMLTRAGCKDVRVLHAPSPEAASDPTFLAAIRECKGIWFSGGRQWRFVDSYLESAALEAFHDVLKAGGVIGGSSAGATIQGDYLVRGNPLGNTDMMAHGYERGFAFMTGVAIDQHFAQRNRFKDLESVKNRFPQLLCLGIDETTAVIVTGHDMQVVGKNNVYVYDRDKPATGEAAYTKLAAGEHYDLKSRGKMKTP